MKKYKLLNHLKINLFSDMRIFPAFIDLFIQRVFCLKNCSNLMLTRNACLIVKIA